MSNDNLNIAIIMDGNRRWANKRQLPIIVGYHKGARALKKIIKECKENKQVNEITVFAFSTENWKRPKAEVDVILKLIKQYIKSEIAELHANKIRFNVIGDLTPFDKNIKELFDYTSNLTKHNAGLKLNVAINYGGRLDFIHAAKNISEEVKKNNIKIDDINEDLIYNNLLGKDIKDIDLLIRTGGEQRLSNFLLWHAAYAEMYFTDTLWPDFNEKELHKALYIYSKRDRRFGSSVSIRHK